MSIIHLCAFASLLLALFVVFAAEGTVNSAAHQVGECLMAEESRLSRETQLYLCY